MFENYHDLSAHIRASHTPEERAYYEAAYFKHPHRLGPEYITASRRLEMKSADTDRRNFFLSYWPQTALENLEKFRASHYDAKPDPVFSPVGDRLRRYYPDLFAHLGCRMDALAEACDSHPDLKLIISRYNDLKTSYFRKLTAADELSDHLVGKPKRTRRHALYRGAFAVIYPDLQRALEVLVMSASCSQSLIDER